jgi:hypothetical protein
LICIAGLEDRRESERRQRHTLHHNAKKDFAIMSAITDNTTAPAVVTIPKAAFNAMTKLLEEFMAVDYPERMEYFEAEVEEAETKEDKRVALAQLKAFVRYGKIFNSWLAQDDQQSLIPRSTATPRE